MLKRPKFEYLGRIGDFCRKYACDTLPILLRGSSDSGTNGTAAALFEFLKANAKRYGKPMRSPVFGCIVIDSTGEKARNLVEDAGKNGNPLGSIDDLFFLAPVEYYSSLTPSRKRAASRSPAPYIQSYNC